MESQPDPIGLKVGVVYDCSLEKKEILYQRFTCKNESILNISEIDYDEISWFGENVSGYSHGKLKESNSIPLTMAHEGKIFGCLVLMCLSSPLVTTSLLPTNMYEIEEHYCSLWNVYFSAKASCFYYDLSLLISYTLISYTIHSCAKLATDGRR